MKVGELVLFDDARLLDGDRSAEVRLFSERLARVLSRGLSLDNE